MDKYKKICGIEPGSIAEEAGIKPGDAILEINGKKINDILGYMYYSREEEITLKIEKTNGEIEIIEIENPDYEDLGMEFEYPLLSEPKHCRNKCVFCFIDQLPKGMRETLYFKDDDSRLSLLHGNYVTLTNLNDEEIKEIAGLHISPINISVHSTDKTCRELLFGHKKSGDIMARMKFFAESGITMNAQIVLCKGINDGENLKKTLEDLCSLYPAVYSVSVVPVGLSRYREGLYPLEPFNKEDAKEVIDTISKIQKKMYKAHGSRVIYIADEFYLKAEMEIPDAKAYEDFPQIENGGGLIAYLKDEFYDALKDLNIKEKNREVSVVTGVAAYPFICSLCSELEKKVKGLKVNVYKIINNFFGENITVTGLLCGCDLKDQLKGKPLGEELIVSKSMLRAGEDILLDDVTVDELEKFLNVKIKSVYNDGYEFIDAILGEEGTL